MSSESEVMRLTFTPGAGCSSKRVTAGPWAMPVRRVSMPKERSVSPRSCAFSMSLWSLSWRSGALPWASRSMGG